MTELHFDGLILGVVTFFIIGVFHPIVIKAEYYFGVKCWWAFALCGVLSGVASLFVDNQTVAACIGVFCCSCFWSILELFDQRERVRKGWFPKNPKRQS